MAVDTKTPAIRFKGFTNAWEQRKLSEVVCRVSVMSDEIGLPRVEYEDINSGQGTLNKNIYEKNSTKQGVLFHENDVLFGKLRPYLKNWLLAGFSGIAVGDFWVLRGDETDSGFVYSLIQSSAFDEVANQSSGTKMPRSDWNLVSNTVFSIPHSKGEQHQIGTFFIHLDSLITLHQRKLKKLQNG
ncbi:MAG TPA: restriction endonuclease subunit S [Clostridia bacterium]|nr:restriction endonuclease subunit S [Clostridia bacterium]